MRLGFLEWKEVDGEFGKKICGAQTIIDKVRQKQRKMINQSPTLDSIFILKINRISFKQIFQEIEGLLNLATCFIKLTRVKQTEEELLADLKSKDRDEEGWGEGINLRVNRVPDIIRKMGRINSLSLTFDGKVVIPDWMDGKDIGNLTISGSMTPEEEAALKARFPKATIRRQR